MTILKPVSLRFFTHCSAFSSVGLNRFGSSFPFPHSFPVKVFMPKCRKAVSSRFCHSNCCRVGIRRAAMSVFCAKEAPSGKLTCFIKYVSFCCVYPGMEEYERQKKEDKSIKCFHKNKELIISETA